MTLRFLEWIWHIRGSVALAPGQSGDEALQRLVPLFRQPGTTHDRGPRALTFEKTDPAAQDKMAVFERGVLRVESGAAGPVLRYHLISRTLLFCALLPLLFLSFAGITYGLHVWQKPSRDAAAKLEKAKRAKKKDELLPQNWIDKAMGAPTPEKPKKDEDKDDKPSLTSCYVFAAIFLILYIVGRILEPRIVRTMFRRALTTA